jgi:hypothetical protein
MDLLGRSADSLPKSAETSAAPRYPLRSLSNSLNARRTSASVMRPSQSDITETYRELALPTDFSRPPACPCDSHLPGLVLAVVQKLLRDGRHAIRYTRQWTGDADARPWGLQVCREDLRGGDARSQALGPAGARSVPFG